MQGHDMSDRLFPTRQPPVSILHTLEAWRERDPDRVALTILRDGEQVESQATYRQLHDRALQVAGALRARLPRGERVLLLPTSSEFVCSFFGCLAAGLIAVPASHPLQPKKVAQWRKLQAIVENSAARLIVAPERSREALAAMQAEHGLFAGCEVLGFEALLADSPAALPSALPSRSADIAFLQYTSGSTGAPKGVMITHANILNNQEVIASLMGTSPHARGLSWLPLHHDMGLSVVLQMASVGCSVVLMSPAAFITRPLRWLEAISRHRATTSGGPNFGYQLAAAALQSPEAAAQHIDLSTWELAFCGAEPISRATVTGFLAAAAPYGLQAGAFYPCYGMAEATVQVTGVARGRGVKYLDLSQSRLSQGLVVPSAPDAGDTKSLVSCGSPCAGNEVRIVGAGGVPVSGEGQVGEIWVRGASVGAGYWDNPEATAETFGAALQGDASGAPFMRTGDLGAIVDGELYVTGRMKDLLIIRGRNLYPQDIEDCVQASVPGLRKGCGAAFSVTVGSEEKLVIVQEVGRTQRRQMDTAAALRCIVAAVGEDIGVQPHQVILVEPATIEKTSSGKIARALCRRAYLQGQLQPVASWTEGQAAEPAPAGPAAGPPDAGAAAALDGALRQELENRIAQVAAPFLRTDARLISRSMAWAELGFDSVNALQLALKVEQAVGIRFDAAVLWECANIQELAQHLARTPGAAAALTGRSGPATATAAASARVAPPPAAPGPAIPQAASVAAVMALSDAEAEALLLKELER